VIQIIVIIVCLVVGGMSVATAYRAGVRAADTRWQADLATLHDDARALARSQRDAHEKEQSDRIALHLARLEEVERERDEARKAASKSDRPGDVVPVDPGWWMRKGRSPGAGAR
jgi:ribose 5-phosphate isomerase RpiB